MEFDEHVFKTGETVLFVAENAIRVGLLTCRRAQIEESYKEHEPNQVERNDLLTYTIQARDGEDDLGDYNLGDYDIFTKNKSGLQAALARLEQKLAEFED